MVVEGGLISVYAVSHERARRWIMPHEKSVMMNNETEEEEKKVVLRSVTNLSNKRL